MKKAQKLKPLENAKSTEICTQKINQKVSEKFINFYFRTRDVLIEIWIAQASKIS